jgi:integrase
VTSFLRRKKWTDHGINVAISIFNRWSRFLAARGVKLVDATGDDCADFINDRLTKVVGATAHKDWQNLVWLYEWLVKEGELPPVRKRGKLIEQINRGPMNDIDAPIINDPDPDRIRHISEVDYRRVMATFNKRKKLDCRNAAICSLMYWSGPRMSEVAAALLDNYDPIKGKLHVLGKGSPPKWRMLVVMGETQEWIDRYLRRRDDDDAALFASTYGGSSATGHMRPDAIASMLERRCAKLGIHVTAHQFRRSYTIEAKRRGVAETEISRQAGWTPTTAKLMMPRYTVDEADALTYEAFRNNDPTARGSRRLRAV